MSSETKARQGILPGWIRARVPFRYFMGVTLVGTYILMVLGSYVKAIGAGLSCPDWPTCYGTWVPFLDPSIISNSPYTALQIFTEWAHRGLAMVMGFMIIGAAIAAWRLGRERAVVWSSAVAVLLLPFQIILGGLTVTENLKPIIVTAHLGTATIILVSLTVATALVWKNETQKSTETQRRTQT
ncbi:MAG: COX15/CtaA family protein [Halobacteria archaeon]|nr:COX15/CtaA family protein [Halobacteria archaeon]